MFQSESIDVMSLVGGGSLFILKKLVPGGTNLGGPFLP